jgi:LmbE family N-acetylglucosaminyl deacetylase
MTNFAGNRRGTLAATLMPALVGAFCLMLAEEPAESTRPTRSEAAASPAEILHELRAFRIVGTVLHVAAHPDDENTQLITYLARGRALRAAYLSVTRGDGGQNLLGPQLGEKLGVARTQELLEARKIDGGRQFFTRAIDYGFSKDVREALRVWGKEEVLGDVVRVIRRFRPDVIVTRFSPEAGGTHGHHTASAVLALEAFRLAGDSTAYREQLGELTAWQPKRILMNTGGGRGRGAATGAPQSISINIAGTDPISGESFAALASRSRGMHRTQGFGQGGGAGRGARGGGGGPTMETMTLLAGEPASVDLMDGIDTTWSRVPGGAPIGQLANDVIARFNAADPAASLPALLEIRRRLAELPRDILLDEKRAQLDRIVQMCLGLVVTTTTPRAEVTADEPVPLRFGATLSANAQVRWVGVRFHLADSTARNFDLPAPRALTPALESPHEIVTPPLRGLPISQPYWLRESGNTGLFRVADTRLIGDAESAPQLRVSYVMEVGGQRMLVPDEPVELVAGVTGVNARRRMHIIAPVSLAFPSEAGVFRPGATRSVSVMARAARANAVGSVGLEVPTGWRVTPASRTFALGAAGDSATFAFDVSAPAAGGQASITAFVQTGSGRFVNQRVEVRYDHIPLQLLQSPARLRASSFAMETRGRRVGYLPGAGDAIPQSLVEMGYEVKMLGASDLTEQGLAGLDAVVIGIRAYNTNAALPAGNEALFAYVERGGTLITQYNTTAMLRTPVAPYALTISDDRVTDENAAVTLLAPDHPVLNTPNRITTADFQGWIQEQGLYYPRTWDSSRFTPILASSDEGEAPLRGSLLVAQHGRGWFVYTGLVFFRQLPAGVPGAYRLFANLVALGK